MAEVWWKGTELDLEHSARFKVNCARDLSQNGRTDSSIAKRTFWDISLALASTLFTAGLN